jgi:hypothetical protein
MILEEVWLNPLDKDETPEADKLVSPDKMELVFRDTLSSLAGAG